MRWPLGSLVLALAAPLGCGAEERSSAASKASKHLPEGTVATVADQPVSGETVARIVQSRSVAPSVALDLAISDAVFAERAREVVPAGTAASIERAAVARALLEALAAESARRGPPTDQELEEIVRERWAELDRPPGVRTTHALVTVKEAEQDASARSLAAKIAGAVSSAVTPEDFERLAKAVPTDGADVRVERLPIIAADGRGIGTKEGAYVPVGEFDLDFARAANALTEPGQLSPVVRSRFGYHVIRLEERVPGASLAPAQRSGLLGAEALTRRASRVRVDLLEKLRAAVPIELDRAVDDLTARAKVTP